MTVVRLFHRLDYLPDWTRHGAVAIGNFDGVHLGHARIVKRAVAAARRLGGPAIVFTFDPHPAEILRPDHAPPPLTWPERKGELLAELGVDAVILYPTDAAFLHLEARQFFDRVVREKLDARAIVEGKNFFFGRDRKGNVELLRHFCDETGLMLEVVEPVHVEGQTVSSSRVRELVSQGRIDQVRGMLTQPYRLRGTVIRGAGRGTRIGYPTANLGMLANLAPGPGIYAGCVRVNDMVWPTAISVGPNPTFGEEHLKIEAHLIGFHGLLYGRPLEVDFLARLRDVRRFASVDDLLRQMGQDVVATGEIVTGGSR